jgi:hypothetical protein
MGLVLLGLSYHDELYPGVLTCFIRRPVLCYDTHFIYVHTYSYRRSAYISQNI